MKKQRTIDPAVLNAKIQERGPMTLSDVIAFLEKYTEGNDDPTRPTGAPDEDGEEQDRADREKYDRDIAETEESLGRGEL